MEFLAGCSCQSTLPVLLQQAAKAEHSAAASEEEPSPSAALASVAEESGGAAASRQPALSAKAKRKQALARADASGASDMLDAYTEPKPAPPPPPPVARPAARQDSMSGPWTPKGETPRGAKQVG